MTAKKVDLRVQALWRFALAISILNLLGHTVFGFEQSWAQPLIALLTAYSLEVLLEFVDARVNGRKLRFHNPTTLFYFLLPAHITGLAVAMLLYANERLLPIAFAAAVAIGSKALLRVPMGTRFHHFLNPSNFGITVTLLSFSWVSIAPPYQFTENLMGAGDWILPGILIISGSFLNLRFTKKVPLILGWLGGFAVQASLRSLLLTTPLVASLLPMTGVAFLLFTFYMVTDPGTTPVRPVSQILFGVSVAVVYGLLTTTHIVFGLFFALTIVCCLRGALLYLTALITSKQAVPLLTETKRPIL